MLKSKDLHPKWRKAGIMKCSINSDVVLIAIFELESYSWLVVDKKELDICHVVYLQAIFFKRGELKLVRA